MSSRNIFGTEGYNGQNMIIDMDNSRIVITNSSATAWDTKALMLDVIQNGRLPEQSLTVSNGLCLQGAN